MEPLYNNPYGPLVLEANLTVPITTPTGPMQAKPYGAHVNPEQSLRGPCKPFCGSCNPHGARVQKPCEVDVNPQQPSRGPCTTTLMEPMYNSLTGPMYNNPYEAYYV